MSTNNAKSTMNPYESRKLLAKTIEHYMFREPKTFLQLDGFHLKNGGDEIMRPDEDGDCLFANPTVELMEGATVRVLIPEETDRMDAIRQLKKITKWLKRCPDLMDYAKPIDNDKNGPDIPF